MYRIQQTSFSFEKVERRTMLHLCALSATEGRYNIKRTFTSNKGRLAHILSLLMELFMFIKGMSRISESLHQGILACQDLTEFLSQPEPGQHNTRLTRCCNEYIISLARSHSPSLRLQSLFHCTKLFCVFKKSLDMSSGIIVAETRTQKPCSSSCLGNSRRLPSKGYN